MSMSSISTLMQHRPRRKSFPTGSPEAGFYSPVSLQGSRVLPKSAKKRLPGLSEKQAKTFLGTAVERVKTEARERHGKWLRRFDCLHLSGRRTRQERWNSFAAIMGPALARVDLATMVLGYVNDNGEFRLNRQRGLSEDSGISESAVSRVLSSLEEAQYIRRKQRRLFHNGQRWITRTMIILRPRLFIDLGLAHQLAQARTRKKEKRRLQLAEFARRKLQQVRQIAANSQAKQARRRSFQARERLAEELLQNEQRVQANRNIAALICTLHEQNPHLSDDEVRRRVQALR
ncbi:MULTISPECIES: hypothetical protein [Pseudomonas]|uniref:Uncharacterized protein n=1 Tax=Pseudomonas lutea TaxID=243924 RepID=A0A9X8MHS5_9PSED|nr:MULTISPECIES: hypothetical protein [Pseudomonas]SER49009.1 hypothetical protein SAMN05216409_1287 [Pseudomonas lutea]